MVEKYSVVLYAIFVLIAYCMVFIFEKLRMHINGECLPGSTDI